MNDDMRYAFKGKTSSRSASGLLLSRRVENTTEKNLLTTSSGATMSAAAEQSALSKRDEIAVELSRQEVSSSEDSAWLGAGWIIFDDSASPVVAVLIAVRSIVSIASAREAAVSRERIVAKFFRILRMSVCEKKVSHSP